VTSKADEGKKGRTGTGVSYNPPRGSEYENQHFFTELQNEVLEIKNIFGETDIIVMGDLNARCSDLIPRGLMEEEENGWYKDNSFSGSSRRSENKVVNEEGRKLISFCEALNLEILNGSREGDAGG
jgi:hypothetical protein